MEKVTLKIHNYFDAKLENVRTGEVKTFKAYNQVQDNWFAKLRDSGSLIIARSISVGDGSGTMSLSRTTLFHRLGGNRVTEESAEVLSHNRFKRVVSVLFTETQVVGNLTEVGLCTSTDSEIVTHALFTDSEGNPITIPKTNTDRLTITATIFAEYELTGPLARFGVCSDLTLSTRLDYESEVGKSVPGTTNYPDFFALLVGRTGGLRHGSSQYHGYIINFNMTTYPVWDYTTTNIKDFSKATSSAHSQANVQSNLVRTYMVEQISSADGNLNTTYQIRSISMEGTFYLPFPNHSVYPPKELNLSLAGDGITSGFNLGIPELMTSGVTVTVDDTVMSSSDYTFYGRDVTMWQGYPSADNRYLIQFLQEPTGTSSERTTTPFLPNRPTLPRATSHTYVYDFETAITIDTLIAPRTSELFYSSDGTNWTSAITLTKSSSTTSESVSFSPISARYWKLVTTPHIGTNPAGDITTSGYNLGFFLNKPQLEFNNPPAAGALIEVTAYTEYPIKNDKWIIDQTIFDITVERGDSE